MLAAVFKLSAPASTSVSLPGLSTAMPRLSAIMPRSSIAMPGLSAVVSKLSSAMLGLSAPAFALVLVPGLSALVSPFASASVLPGLSLLYFFALFLSKTSTPNLATKKRKLDDTISGWSERSKKISSKELWSGKIKKAALEEVFLPRVSLFPLLFPPSGIGKRKFNKTIINTWLLTDNHAKEEVNLSFARCRCPPAIKLNRPSQIEILKQRPGCIVKIISLATATF